MRKIFTLLVLTFILSITTSTANAAMMNYSFKGTGSGSFGKTSFTNQNFTFEFLADTDNVYSGDYGIYKLLTASSKININGFALASFLEPIRLFMNAGNNALGFQDDAHYDLLDIEDNALAGYQLKTAIGPIHEDNPFAFYQFNNVNTDSGLLTLSNVESVDFQASPVPEPSSIVLGLISLSGLLGLKRRRIA